MLDFMLQVIIQLKKSKGEENGEKKKELSTEYSVPRHGGYCKHHNQILETFVTQHENGNRFKNWRVLQPCRSMRPFICKKYILFTLVCNPNSTLLSPKQTGLFKGVLCTTYYDQKLDFIIDLRLLFNCQLELLERQLQKLED